MDRRDFLKLSAAAATLSIATDQAWAQTAKTEVLWMGQAATRITTPSGKVIVIDPFLVNNPKTPAHYKNLDGVGKVDVILVTHGHGDHTGDVKELAARTGAKVFGPAGLIATMIDLGWVTSEQGVRFGKGGRVNPLGPQVTITQVRAEHSSEVTVVDPATKKCDDLPRGEPAGFIEMENGFKLYHMGDTGLRGLAADQRLLQARPDPHADRRPLRYGSAGRRLRHEGAAEAALRDPHSLRDLPGAAGNAAGVSAAARADHHPGLSDQPGGQAHLLRDGVAARLIAHASARWPDARAWWVARPRADAMTAWSGASVVAPAG